MSQPLVIAHRGASAHHPENSLVAFAAAVELGADGVELDVRLAADGGLVVAHDPNLLDGRAVAELACADLPDGVCVLAAALAACADLLVNVEIKADGPGGGLPLVEPVLAACATWGGRALVSSFDPATVDAVHAADPAVPTAQLTFLPDRPAFELAAWVAERGHDAWHPHHATLDQAAVAAAHDAGVAVNTWTVDDPTRIAELASWDVDGVVTNDVPTALAALHHRPDR